MSKEERPQESSGRGQEPSRMIGGYRVVREIGRGGMGVVYEAQQQHPRRAVALKVIRGETYVDTARIKMFEREAQTLARLRHPHIAGIYESGRTEDGQHFFAMELVRGMTLGEYLKARSDYQLTSDEIRERLQLFTKICYAVSYAHQRGIIHRDLKPANILVAPPDSGTSSGQPGPDIKILDFGLARITDADMAASQLSDAGSIQGTLPYMSPEQVRGEVDEIDVRSDVYSLGVLLYEMLTGEQPYEIQLIALHEAARVICEQPPKPFAKAWAGPRRPDADLVTIVHKALEKEPSRRYQSAAALAEDVMRNLSAQPILARPPSTAYQLRKLIARHRASFAFAVTLIALLLTFAIGTTVQARRIAAERDRANQESMTAKQVVSFLTALFRVPDPSESLGNTITAREILDEGAERIRAELADQPAVQARLMATMGEVYDSLGLREQAYELAEAAYRTQQSLHPEGHHDLAAALLLRSSVQHHRGNYSEAEALARGALAMYRRLPGDHAEGVSTSLHQLAITLKVAGKLPEAETAYRGALAIRREILGNRDLRTASTLTSLAELLRVKGELDQAEGLHREALDIARSLHGDIHPEVGSCLNNLALVLQAKRDYPAAEALLREVLDLRRKLHGEQDSHVANALNNLAALLRDSRKWDEAEAMHRQALIMRRQVLGPDHAEVASSLNNLAVVLRDKGERAAAVPLMREAIEIVRRSMGEDHPRLGISFYNLGNLLYAERDYAGAAEALQQALPILRQSLSEDHWRVGRVHSAIGYCLLKTDDLEHAEPWLLRGYETLRNARGEDHRDTLRAAKRLVEFYELAGKPDEAAGYRDHRSGR